MVADTYAVDAVVIGAGVIGLACARALALSGRETLILESADRFGEGISSRNSEVIHAGIYYRPGSAKARFCRLGSELLYAYCAENGIAHQQPGKWVVANGADQEQRLAEILAIGQENGCEELHYLSRREFMRQEPAIRASAVLSSPKTGIVSSYELMLALLAESEANGAILVTRTQVDKVRVEHRGFRLRAGREATHIRSRLLINAAGLSAPQLASDIQGFPKDRIPPHCYAKGQYFVLNARSPFSRLVYPLPEPGGLGVHLTLDLQGRARFGPDVSWVSAPEYQVDEERRSAFLAAIKAYWPACQGRQLAPGYAGVRPKLGTRDRPWDDFCIQGPLEHGVPGLVNLFGIESPGLTCCLSIADHVVQLADEPGAAQYQCHQIRADLPC